MAIFGNRNYIRDIHYTTTSNSHNSKFLIFPLFLFFIGVGANFFGEILQPQGGSANGQMAGNGTTPSGKLVSGDLDASLANLTSNLNLNAGHGK